MGNWSTNLRQNNRHILLIFKSKTPVNRFDFAICIAAPDNNGTNLPVTRALLSMSLLIISLH